MSFRFAQRCRAVWLLQLVSALGYGQPRAPAPAEKAEATSDAPQRAQTHFQNGVKLYQDKNYSGALAEFEAAYKLKPGFSSLQNVALCLKALFRYTEAAETLRRALEQHAETLSPAEKKQLQSAIDELAALVGTLVVKVSPSDARVTVDGRELAAADYQRGVALNVGEHVVNAEAPGYARASNVVRLASQEVRELELGLTATHGFLTVEAKHPETTISIDGIARGAGRWSGPLTPGSHVVRLTAPGATPSEQAVAITLGKTTRLNDAASPPSEAPEPLSAATEPSSAAADGSFRGWYGLLGLTALRMTAQPAGFTKPSDVAGALLGLRGGYRPWAPLGLELLLELGNETATAACGSRCASGTAKYTLGAARLGANARLLSRGESLRFSATLGFGVVNHVFTIDSTSDPNLPRGEVGKGSSAYAACELGAQYNIRHLLLELDAMFFLDGVGGLNGAQFGNAPTNVFGDRKVLPFIGLGVKVGLSQWAPARAKAKTR